MLLFSFYVLTLTGMFIMSFGSFGTWLLCTMMDVTRKMILLPLGIGLLLVWVAKHFFLAGVCS